MRHRGQNETSKTDTKASSANGALRTLAELRTTTATQASGKHRAPVELPPIPEQMLPTHDAVVEAPDAPEQAATTTFDRASTARVSRLTPSTEAPARNIPDQAQWRASHLPRVFAGTLLALAVAGTAGLGVRYVQTRGSDDFISLAIGLGVIVVLWAVLIASTPQVVKLDGSVLSVSNTSGAETFDLADALQAVDVVGDPRTSHWAVLLHRPNSTTVVLRRHDVDAFEVDTIVRHFRSVANRRFSDRESRFNR